MSMEQNGNHQNMAPPLFCRNGCGFYAAQAFDGMCSKCYKDLKLPDPGQGTVVSSGSPPTSARLLAAGGGHSDDVDAVAAALSKTSLGEINLNTSSNSNSSENKRSELTALPLSDVETGVTTVPVTGKASSSTDGDLTEAGADAAIGDDDGSNDDEKGKKPKKNRCQECRKKVGLTGFQCHCGKLFCSFHRYSDTHGCTFDFKEKGQEEIRRNNPVVKGEKIQKI